MAQCIYLLCSNFFAFRPPAQKGARPRVRRAFAYKGGAAASSARRTDLQLGEVMDERRAGKRLIILITGRIKINAPPGEGEAVVPADHCSYCIGVDFVGIAGGGRRRGRADHI